ncbi:MAG: hypothetical protein V3T15_07570, partial [Pseudomonadales bacterium]
MSRNVPNLPFLDLRCGFIDVVYFEHRNALSRNRTHPLAFTCKRKRDISCGKLSPVVAVAKLQLQSEPFFIEANLAIECACHHEDLPKSFDA